MKLKEFFTKLGQKLSGKIVIERKKEKEEYVEVEPARPRKTAKIIVKYFTLHEFADIKPVIEALRERYIIALVNIKPLKEKDREELKRAINKIKRTVDAIEGKVVGVQDFILAVPDFVEIEK